MRITKRLIEKRLDFINRETGLDYEVDHNTSYTFAYKIISNKGSHDQTTRLTAAEAFAWCTGFINAMNSTYTLRKR